MDSGIQYVSSDSDSTPIMYPRNEVSCSRRKADTTCSSTAHARSNEEHFGAVYPTFRDPQNFIVSRKFLVQFVLNI